MKHQCIQVGQVDWTHDPVTNFTFFAYDLDTGRQVATTNSLGNATFTQFDPRGNVLGNWGATYPVLYDFDEFNRMVAMYTLRTNLTASDYSGFRSQVSSFDQTRWLYDLSTGLLTNKVYADTTGVNYTYTADGKLASGIWARGIVTSYSFDPASGSMTNISYSDGTHSISFTLDRLGRQTTVTDRQGTRVFTYNDALLLAMETNVNAVISRSYDLFGRSNGFTLGNDYSVGYGFDGVGRFSSLSSVISPLSSNSWTYSYLANSDLLSGWDNGAVSVVKSYEPNRNLLTGVDNRTNGVTVSRFDYVNDALGRRTQRIDNGSVANSFGYNDRSELTNALMGANAFGYQFDNIGNRQTSSNNTEALSYAVNNLNQYTNISDGVAVTPRYDLDGNLTNYGAFAFVWDAENRLASVSSNGTLVASFKYDYMGRRYEKVVGAVTNTFIWDGWNCIAEISSATGNTNYFVWGLDVSGTLQGAGGIGGLLSETKSDGTYFPVADGNGNISEYLATDGAVVAHYEFSPFGKLTAFTVSENLHLPFRFSSKYFDEETGTYYWDYRHYWPEFAWMSRDPLREESFANANGPAVLYSSVFIRGIVGTEYDFNGNDALTSIDAFGLCPSGCQRTLAQISRTFDLPAEGLLAVVKLQVKYTTSTDIENCSITCPSCGCGNVVTTTIKNMGSFAGSVPIPIAAVPAVRLAVKYGFVAGGENKAVFNTCNNTLTRSGCKTLQFTLGGEACLEVPPFAKFCLSATGGIEFRQCDDLPETQSGTFTILFKSCFMQICREHPLYRYPPRGGGPVL